MTWSRRSLLAAAGALALPRRGWAEDAPVLGGRLRPDPDFSALRATGARQIGVRPHRLGGVRLELAEPLVGGARPKQVVHNYGHGAAGITLSLGCAEQAAERVVEALAKLDGQPASIAVIGTGIIGLSTASAIRRRVPAVPLTLYAKDLDVRTTTSWVAGGQFEPSGVWREYAEGDGPDRLSAMLRASRDRIAALTPQWEAYGIVARDQFNLDHDSTGLDRFTPRDVVPAHLSGRLPFVNLPVPGRMYTTWLLNPMLMLPAFVQELTASGVSFVERRFDTVADVAKLPENVVVNCTGYGAKALWGDDQLIAQRGHLVALERTDPRQDWLFAGGCDNRVISYVFCRQHDVVVGGTWGLEDDDLTVRPEDAAVFDRVLNNARLVFAGQPDACLR